MPSQAGPGVTTPTPAAPPLRLVGRSAASWTSPVRVDYARLIGRSNHPIDREAVGRVLTGRRVLITGAGGSIGSELARLAATFQPEELLLMERAENALFDIDLQLSRRFPTVPRRAMLHDVADEDETLRLVLDARPHIVFHAAAHKHVPLMEDHPAHALVNNLFGTRAIADAADASGAERFVMISTDKAVHPSSVMGATKRLAEIYVGALASRSKTRLSMVRFGNVLGSACSVLPIWAGQIDDGGPVTVTDPRMTRYFMTIPEAAALVAQAAALDAPRGHAPVYVLDMGEPVRILELAVRFAAAHGLRARLPDGCGVADPADAVPAPVSTPLPPDAPEIDVTITGARPGEKMHEQLAYAAEHLAPTERPGIRVWRGDPCAAALAPATVMRMIADLARVRAGADAASVLAALRRHVPELPERPAARA